MNIYWDTRLRRFTYWQIVYIVLSYRKVFRPSIRRINLCNTFDLHSRSQEPHRSVRLYSSFFGYFFTPHIPHLCMSHLDRQDNPTWCIFGWNSNPQSLLAPWKYSRYALFVFVSSSYLTSQLFIATCVSSLSMCVETWESKEICMIIWGPMMMIMMMMNLLVCWWWATTSAHNLNSSSLG